MTLRKLDEEVKRKLRLLAATHQRSMEAEVREILTEAVWKSDQPVESADTSGERRRFDGLAGRWRGRGHRDEIMLELRGDE